MGLVAQCIRVPPIQPCTRDAKTAAFRDDSGNEVSVHGRLVSQLQEIPRINACMVAHAAHETNHAISGALTNEVCKCLESEPDKTLAEAFRTVSSRVKDIYRGGRLNHKPLQDPEVMDQCSDVRLRTLRVSA